jgi:hypothetical protein
MMECQHGCCSESRMWAFGWQGRGGQVRSERRCSPSDVEMDGGRERWFAADVGVGGCEFRLSRSAPHGRRTDGFRTLPCTPANRT